MAVDPGANAPAVFDLKSASLTLVALLLKTTDIATLAEELDHRFGDAPDLFDHDPVVVDLSPVADATGPLDFEALIALLRERKMLPVAAKGGSAAQMEAARAAGLSEAPETAAPAPARETPAEIPATGAAAAPALIADRPLRSGQQVYARAGDLAVLAVVSFGAEVIADRNIHV